MNHMDCKFTQKQKQKKENHSDHTKAATEDVLLKKVFLKTSQNSHIKTPARFSFLIDYSSEACNFIKRETLAQVLSCEFCEISKNTFSKEQIRTTSSYHKQFNYTINMMDQLRGFLIYTHTPRHPNRRTNS